MSADGQLTRIENKVDLLGRSLMRIERLLIDLTRLEIAQMANIDDLLAEVQRQTTVEQGIAALIDKLRADVLAAGGDAAKIDAAFAAVKANTDALSEKLVENTPAAEPAPADSGSTG